MTKQNKNLLILWLCLIGSIVFFAVTIEFVYHLRQENNYLYRFKIIFDDEINKKLLASESNSVAPPSSEINEANKQEQVIILNDADFFESTKYGDLPKIAFNGVKPYNAFSSKITIDATKKNKLGLAVIVDNISLSEMLTILQQLGTSKITFIIPHYLDNIKEISKLICDNKHEFLLVIPTQTAINSDKNISPILANDNIDDTLVKLMSVLSSTQKYIGIANITPTLLTKSVKDMDTITSILAKRGLIFFDIESTNTLAKELAQKNNCKYIDAPYNLQESILLPKKIYNMYTINAKYLLSFVKKISPQSNLQIVPISCVTKDFN